jgi:hypothetical protein
MTLDCRWTARQFAAVVNRWCLALRALNHGAVEREPQAIQPKLERPSADPRVARGARAYWCWGKWQPPPSARLRKGRQPPGHKRSAALAGEASGMRLIKRCKKLSAS